MKLLLLPPANLLLLAGLLLALGWIWKVRLRWAWVFLAAATYVLSAPFTADRLLGWHQVHPPLRAERPQAPAGQAIVVLSAGLRSHAAGYGQPKLDALSTTRLLYAAELAERTNLPVLVSGGLWGGHPRPIADEMAAFLRRWSEAEVAWTERRARDTWENARYSTRLLSDAGIDRAYVVTHAWHMPRALHAFRRHGFDAIPAPTGFVEPGGASPSELLPSARGVQAASWAVHEALGRIAYRLFRADPGTLTPAAGLDGDGPESPAGSR